MAIPEAPYAEVEEIENLRQWVEAGGILIARPTAEGVLLRTPEGSDGPRETLLAAPTAAQRLVKTVIRGAPPRRFVLSCGRANDEKFLFGEWYAAEPGGMISKDSAVCMRWTSAAAGCYLPCNPDEDATLVLRANLTLQSLGGTNGVLVNGVQVGTIDKSGSRVWRFPVAKKILSGKSVAEMTFKIQTFAPENKGDSRSLGLAVGAIEFCSVGAENEPVADTALALEVDWPQVESRVKRIGRGATLEVSGQSALDFNAVVAEVMRHPERLIPDAKGVELPVVATDGVFATRLSDGVLYYNSTAEPHKMTEGEVPAVGILEVRGAPGVGGER